VLADLDSARHMDPATAAAEQAALARTLVRALLPPRAMGALSREVAAPLEHALHQGADLRAVIGALDRAALLAARD